MGWAVFIGTIPVVIFGLLFKDQIETVLRGAMFVAAMLFGVSILMLIADRMGRRARAAESVNVMDGFVVGLFQCLALIPGASRSGSVWIVKRLRGSRSCSACRACSVPAFTNSSRAGMR